MSAKTNNRSAIILGSTAGRHYDMGKLSATFKADGEETNSDYSISEWWLEPHTLGPGIHSHPEDDIFYVLEGALSVFIEDKWITAEKGSFILVPGETEHDFENRSDKKVGFLNFSQPGGFEGNMPSIASWFKVNRP
jgi:quercetin dioxygenase-like cupin family protein